MAIGRWVQSLALFCLLLMAGTAARAEEQPKIYYGVYAEAFETSLFIDLQTGEKSWLEADGQVWEQIVAHRVEREGRGSGTMVALAIEARTQVAPENMDDAFHGFGHLGVHDRRIIVERIVDIVPIGQERFWRLANEGFQKPQKGDEPPMGRPVDIRQSDVGPERRIGSAYDMAVDWGTGQLALSPNIDRMMLDEYGLEKFALPLFVAPGAGQWGWLDHGLVIDQQNMRGYKIPTYLTRYVSKDPEISALFVDHVTDSGWVALRFADPDGPRGGIAWTHPAYQADIYAGAEFQNWEKRFDGGLLAFRDNETGHAFQASPDDDGALLFSLDGRDYDMTMLAIDGDWMRVRLTMPSACSGAAPETTLEAWVKWRSDDVGPLLYRQSGGC